MTDEGRETMLDRLVRLLRMLLGTTRGRILTAAIAGVLLVVLRHESNPNPFRPEENAEPFVWPEGGTQEAIDDAIAKAKIEGGSPVIPCACATPQNEIKDWHERGLTDFTYTKRGRPSYFRIGNGAAAIVKRNSWTSRPICFFRNYSSSWWLHKKFFVVKGGEK